MRKLLFVFLIPVAAVLASPRLQAQHKDSETTSYVRICRLLRPEEIPYDASIEDSIIARLTNIRAETEILMRYSLWQKYFTDAIEDKELPSCFQYLPLALSRMEIQAEDAYDRAGVWKISRLTAMRYGLHCDSLIDERFDPQIASQTAAAELKRLLNLYEGNVWECLLAYCVSPSAVNAQKIRLRCDNPSPWLLQQDARYFPVNILASFLSWMYIFQENGTCPAPRNASYRICIEKPVYRHQLTELMQCPDEDFICNNPSLTGFHIPPGTFLCFSQTQLKQWNSIKDSLYFLFEYQKVLDSIARMQADSLKRQQDSVQQVQDSLRQAKAAAEKASGKTIYTVKSGDILGKISQRYGVSVADIKRWNGLKSDIIQIGQKLIIYRK